MQYHPPRSERERNFRGDNDNAERALRRSRSSVRRYCVHNGLEHMPTLTYAQPRTTLAEVYADLRNFRDRVLRASWGPSEAFPYLAVPERGKQGTQRLHVHLGIAFWSEHGCVECCDRCIRPKLRAMRLRQGEAIPPRSASCWGCVWRHGFVGAPSEGTGDPRALASYVSKYLSKDLGELVEAGKHRYWVAEGFQPEGVRLAGRSWAEVVGQLDELLPVGEADVRPLHQLVEDWKAPPTWALQWEVA